MQAPHLTTLKDGDDKKVFVALLSGKDCECLWLQDRTIRQLKEEAQPKLDLTIKNLIGPNMEPLDEEKMLAEENVMPGTTLTVVAAAWHVTGPFMSMSMSVTLRVDNEGKHAS
ncbi:unnamed protein product [Cladocopium goreaui]|uniref:Uncharacterized protein n=1 Tax=Cladocopium goreaui TaxID=2562237 RepID=A0A9P1CHK1_9DINO|nr:unnamed protein product [Cladocopium goreaui]